MPSSRHEMLVVLLRQTASTFLAEMLPSDWRDVTWRGGNASLATPEGKERRADLVLIDASDPPRAGLVVEVQLRWVRRKLYTLPYYQFAVRQQYECPVVSIVVTPSALVARRFRTAIDTGGGHRWRARVIGPRETWAYFLRHETEPHPFDVLLLVATIAGKRDDGRLARRLFADARRVDSALNAGYVEWALNSLSEVGARVLKELIMNSKRTPHPTDYNNPLFRWMYGTGLDEGRDEGREEGERLTLLAFAQRLLPATEYAQVTKISDLTELRERVWARVPAVQGEE